MKNKSTRCFSKYRFGLLYFVCMRVSLRLLLLLLVFFKYFFFIRPKKIAIFNLFLTFIAMCSSLLFACWPKTPRSFFSSYMFMCECIACMKCWSWSWSLIAIQFLWNNFWFDYFRCLRICYTLKQCWWCCYALLCPAMLCIEATHWLHTSSIRMCICAYSI